MRWLHTTPREGVLGALERMLTFNSDRAMERAKSPSHNAFIQPNASHLPYPGTPHTVFPGVSHCLMMDEPARFNAALTAFLTTLPPR